ncbi:hypothetical protein K4K59_011173 [Colletotrichum sp. SAR11_240]|nr:hypothetical protein K4K59_011173 [Colletotrichum sp. SAR11_240]
MRRGPRDHLVEDSLLPREDLRDILFPDNEDDSVKRCSARGVSGFAVEDDESEDEDDRRDDKNGYKSSQASNPSRHSAEDRFGTEGPGYTSRPTHFKRLECFAQGSLIDESTGSKLTARGHFSQSEPAQFHNFKCRSCYGSPFEARGASRSQRAPEVLNCLNDQYRGSYAGFPHDNPPLTNSQSTPTREAGSRRRSNTLPNPPTVNELDHGDPQFDESCADYCPSTPGLYQSIDIQNRASPAVVSQTLSDDEGSACRRSTFQQSEDPHTPMRKGRARVFTGNLQPVSETKIVEGFSPLSYNKGPERKRSVKRTEQKSRSGNQNQRAKGRDTVAGQNAQSTMVQHIVNIADRLDGNEAVAASDQDSNGEDDESLRGYTHNASDHVKTQHRPMGPMEKKRRSGIAQLQNQREAKKEKKLPIVSSPAEK